MKVTQLNHVAIHVKDNDASCRFYHEVLGLEQMPRPDFGFPGAWFRLGVDQELHLIGREAQTGMPPTERHYALMVDDIDAFAQRLKEMELEFRGPSPRPDGARQIFLRDPDGHVIELCTWPGEVQVDR